MHGQTIGVAGCGAMGLPMAQALLAAGFKVKGFDVRPLQEFGSFAEHMIADPAQFAKTCDTVICVVRDEAQVLDLCFDDQAVFTGPDSPQTFILSSTVSPAFVQTVRDRLDDKTQMLDAPMSGAPLAAIAATLTFMIGGQFDLFEKFEPTFNAMGSKNHHLGNLGAGMTAKVLNNFVAATTVVSVRNVLHHAQKLGMDKNTLLDVMQQSSGQTWFGSNFNEINWADELYDKANTIGILEKDVKSFIAALEDGPEPIHQAVLTALQTLPPLTD